MTTIDEQPMFSGERLKAIRKERGYTQQSLADALGIDRTTITGYEIDKGLPQPAILRALADRLQVSIDYLMCRTDNPDLPPASESDEVRLLIRTWDELSDADRKDVRSFVERKRAQRQKEAKSVDRDPGSSEGGPRPPARGGVDTP